MTRKSQHHARRTPILAIALVAGAFSMASQIEDASAHGRVLRTSGIAVGPTRWYQRTPTDWLVATTFGSAVSHDQGQSFHWICDEAVGGMTNFDGIVRVPQKDTLVIGNRNGLFVSRDGGCSFATDPNFAPPAQITAISISAHDPARWYVTVNTPDASQGALWTTQDNAKTFAKLPLPAEHFYLDAVASSEADAQLLVVAGSQNRKSAGSPLWTSRDGGASWTESWVKNAPWAAALPKIALHPKDPSVMLVSWLDVTNNTSYVLRSTDSGKSFTPVLHPPEPTTAVSFADGGHAAFVSGSYHFYVSRDGGARFAQQTHPQGNACMALSQDRIYACGAEGLDAFSMAMRGVDDNTWQPVLRLPQLQGPYHCREGAPVYEACAALWPAYAQKLGATAAAL